MLKQLKMNEQEVDKTERTMHFIARLNDSITLVYDMIIYIALAIMFAYLSRLIVVTSTILEAIYIGIGLVVMMYVLVYPILKFIEDIICGVIFAPIIEETSKLIYSNKGLLTKFIKMFNLDENMAYYIYKDPETKDIYYDVDTGIYRIRTQCMHIISAYIIKTKSSFNSKVLSYLTAICVHAMFNLTAILPGVLGFKIWRKYADHLISKYGHLLDEYKADITKIEKEQLNISKLHETAIRKYYYKKVIRCYPNVQFI